MLCQSVICSRKGFVFVQVFYWSHLSYIWVWALLIVHCANFWKWFVAPGLMFLIEKLVGIAVSRMGGLYIVEVNLLPSKVPSEPMYIFWCILFTGTFSQSSMLKASPLLPFISKVTHLVIKRPPFFHFKPGDYVYINIPVIAKYEWHPFTISSAPEQQGKTIHQSCEVLIRDSDLFLFQLYVHLNSIQMHYRKIVFIFCQCFCLVLFCS